MSRTLVVFLFTLCLVSADAYGGNSITKECLADLHAGNEFYQNGNLASALNLYTQAAACGGWPTPVIAQADTLMRKKECPRAIELGRSVLGSDILSTEQRDHANEIIAYCDEKERAVKRTTAYLRSAGQVNFSPGFSKNDKTSKDQAKIAAIAQDLKKFSVGCSEFADAESGSFHPMGETTQFSQNPRCVLDERYGLYLNTSLSEDQVRRILNGEKLPLDEVSGPLSLDEAIELSKQQRNLSAEDAYR